MPPERFDRDDVERALDALAAEQPAPKGDASSVLARGHRRIRQRRTALIGILFAFVATAATVGLVAHAHHDSRVTSRDFPATTTTNAATPTTAAAAPPPPPQLAFVSPTEGWICGRSLLHTTDDFNEFTTSPGEVTIPAPPERVAAGHQPSLCAAVPGGNAWLLRASADPDRPELVRVQGTSASVLPFARIPDSVVVSIDFVDANRGWALVAHLSRVREDLYTTHDGGVTWSIRRGYAPLAARSGFTQLEFASSTRGWAEGALLPQLATTTDGGRTWRGVDVPTPSTATLFSGVAPALVEGKVVVAYGGWSTGEKLLPFFDVSTDGGRTWSLRSGPPGVDVSGVRPSAFAATDADHWVLGWHNRVFVTDDGGRNWSERAQFAGVSTIQHVARPSANVIIVSAASNLSNHATVVLATTDAGNDWSTVDSYNPPAPGGIIGCPTRPLTPPPAGDPRADIARAARAYVQFPNPTVSGVFRVGGTGGEFFGIFNHNVGSCGRAVVDNTWVAYVHGVPNAGPGGSTGQVTVALAHYADGWHVFGRYP